MWLHAVLVCLAVYRLTRLLTRDRITDKARLAIYRWACLRANPWAKTPEDRVLVLRNIATNATPEPLLAYYVTCPWCVGMWVSALIVGVDALVLGNLPYPVLLWLAASAVTGLLAAHEE